eukprot:3350409-Pyramimonas_sp.AAC.1
MLTLGNLAAKASGTWPAKAPRTGRIPRPRMRASSLRLRRLRLSIQSRVRGPAHPWMFPISFHGRKAGPVKKVCSSSTLRPYSVKIRIHSHSCPISASGMLIPFMAIQSMCFSQYSHGVNPRL